MKKTLSVLGQFLLLFFVDAVGSLFYHPFGITTATPTAAAPSRSFQWDGLLLTALVYLVILLIEAMRKRLRVAAPRSSVALLLAMTAGYLLKLGFMQHKW